MNCPQCQGEMYDNRLTKKNPKAPDYKCKDPNCLDDKGYVTAVWEKKTIPKAASKPKVDSAVWEARDRMNMYQTALNCASTLAAARINKDEDIKSSQVLKVADEFFAKLKEAKKNGDIDAVDDVIEKGEF